MQFQWKSLPTFVLLLWTSTKFCWMQRTDVTYQDIRSVDATCNGLDSCRVPRSNEAWKYNCNCEKTCSLYGTCCVDSKYRRKFKRKNQKNLECRVINHNRKFLYPWIRSCNPDLRHSKTMEELCTNKFLIETNADPFLAIPVTDPLTGITYQNYYCFACNENSGEERLIPWDVAVGGDLEKVNKSDSIPILRNYEKDFWSWVLDNDNNTHLSLWPSIPEGLEDTLPYCYGFEIVSECASSYTNANVRKKCGAYMALTRIRIDNSYSYYRNPHCAICNYENMDDMVCVLDGEDPVSAPGGLIPSGDFFVRLFSFETDKCTDKMVYDSFAKKCRNIYRARRQ
ncbi:uncharacterized protein [Parasteatoda tepidariorum]|uniref:uncharacterized protein n=1 Tax=Parasteatoda tepidariorum TaxID=114398 RepID=UPI001C720C0B|nr:uncharacterized protein LOC107442160 [Parasteatoda tepidariorum]XP_015911135.2 uncharacterized protein LOC107442160 [Parasteatoda tepidariorum]XP_042900164.1 uncharacterized protein LOC107442160 [Parasteatoda tepidariorum]XP_042900165.1 uncharacterized protein LOC107442160 [Parasteatoda tepidariorum]